MTRIAATLPVRNAAATIHPCIASLRAHVDLICILDTGSTDNTLALLDDLAREPGCPILIERGGWHEDFARARNQALDLIPADHEWAVPLSADDTICHGGELLRGLAKLGDDVDGYVVAYDHGTGPLTIRDELLFLLRRAAGWRYTGRVFEQLKPSRPVNVQRLRREDILIRHHGATAARLHDPDIIRRYLRLLELQAEDETRRDGAPSPWTKHWQRTLERRLWKGDHG